VNGTSSSARSSNGASAKPLRHAPLSTRGRPVRPVRRETVRTASMAAGGGPGSNPPSQDGQGAARPQHAGQLRRSAPRVEPVEGIGDEGRVHGGVGERDRLGRAGEPARTRHDPLAQGAHPVERLDADDLAEPRHEHAGQLAGAGREVEHDVAAHAVGHGRRPVGAAALVQLRDGVVAEALVVGHGGCSIVAPP
jgi:hypothetical protein